LMVDSGHYLQLTNINPPITSSLDKDGKPSQHLHNSFKSSSQSNSIIDNMKGGEEDEKGGDSKPYSNSRLGHCFCCLRTFPGGGFEENAFHGLKILI
jgi:hypothetical protein